MDENKDKNEQNHIQVVRGDLGIVTGPALVGGAKLIYDMGKDVYSWFKSEKKLFIQLVNSSYIANYHEITARFANVYIHGIHIESVRVKDAHPENIQTFFSKQSSVSFGISEVKFPHLLLPNGTIDVNIKIPELTEKWILNANGTSLVCNFAPVNKLGDFETVSIPIRLRWST